MPETLVENQICEDCGTDVRPEALFCYHCGGPVTEEGRGMVAEKASEDDGEVLPVEPEDPSEDAPEESVLSAVDVPIKKPNETLTKKKLESAASIRNRARPLQPKKIEIIWEDHENRPNIWFIAVALVLTCAVLAILIVAIYLG